MYEQTHVQLSTMVHHVEVWEREGCVYSHSWLGYHSALVASLWANTPTNFPSFKASHYKMYFVAREGT